MDLRPRTLIQRLNDAVAHADGEHDDDQEQPEPEPEPAPTVSAQPETLRIGDRAPDWWDSKPLISDDRTAADGSSVKWINGIPHHVPAPEPVKVCEHPNPHAVRARPTGELVAFWCADCETQLDVPEDYDELDDVEDAEGAEDGEEGGEGEDGDKVPAKIRRQWSVLGNGKKVYSRPKYRSSGKREETKSLLDAWHGMRPVTRHGLYNATALGVGFSLGVPQFFTAETAYLVQTYGSWTDFYVCIWYGVAIGVWMIDHRTRNWLPPFALLGRMPLVSMVVGVLLYGNPV
ncbi:hypothetical protein [Streptomyces sp. A1136]|uniref:hypothetical protein n=1 Tax=Streptomyces sp. A1136 TaxID=2563102 RepID=UPI0014481C92|nr:hypothetical protein [Streptomyces sp. A1136]